MKAKRHTLYVIRDKHGVCWQHSNRVPETWPRRYEAASELPWLREQFPRRGWRVARAALTVPVTPESR